MACCAAGHAFCHRHRILPANAGSRIVRQQETKSGSTACEAQIRNRCTAHNESLNIKATLHNLLKEVKYPSDKYSVFVIADNCTDDTAIVATENGAECLVRVDTGRKGKGWALDWAFSSLLNTPFDAFLVVDADCRIDQHALMVLDQCLCAGHSVLQLDYVADNPDDSPVSYATCVANALENCYWYQPKSQLGLSVFLRGTGMAFRREVLESIPWNAASIVEDLEYSLTLIRRKVPIQYLATAAVYSEFPVDADAFRVQRERWAGGGARLQDTKRRCFFGRESAKQI